MPSKVVWAALVVVAVGAGGFALFRAQQQPEPPKGIPALVINDTKVGDGAEFKTGSVGFVLYRGTLLDGGSEFDSNLDPRTKLPFLVALGAGGVIQGWTEGLEGMRVGGERTLEIPFAKAYGAEGSPPAIPPFADLRFEIRLLHVVKPGEEDLVETTDTKVGTGAAVRDGDTVTIHYRGEYLNGRPFDDSRLRGEPATFRLGDHRVFPGLEAGIVGMRPGGERRMIVPPLLMLGPGGGEGLEADQPGVFTVTLLSVQPGR